MYVCMYVCTVNKRGREKKKREINKERMKTTEIRCKNNELREKKNTAKKVKTRLLHRNIKGKVIN